MNIFSKQSLLCKAGSITGVIFVVVIIGLSLYIPHQLEQAAQTQAIQSAQNTVNQFKQVRGYYTANIIKQAKASGVLTPHYNHKDDNSRIPLPATMIHELSQAFEKHGTSLKLYSAYPFPHRRGRQLDDFQSEAWSALTKAPEKAYSRRTLLNGEPVVRVAMADTMQAEACVTCHNTHPDTPRTGWKLGDVRGVLEVQIPIGEQLALSQSLGWKISGLLILSLVIILAVLTYIFRTLIGARLDHMRVALQAIANGKGDLKQRLDDSQNDEISEVARSFNQFLDGMQQMVGSLNERSQELFDASSILRTASKETCEGTEKQDRETDQIASAVTQMSGTADEVTALAKETSVQAQQAALTIEQGREIVTQSVGSINNLALEIKVTTDVIKTLEADSADIGSVLDVIRGIAEQTNLLALNAAIEAARAGEQGRGFAVVADEVRTLASRTQSSTEEIQQMIEKLQAGVKNAVKAMGQGGQQLEITLKQSDETQNAMEAIAIAMEEIHAVNSKITLAADSQSTATEEINRNIYQVSEISQSCAQNAAESERAANSLADSSDKIANTLSRFKI